MSGKEQAQRRLPLCGVTVAALLRHRMPRSSSPFNVANRRLARENDPEIRQAQQRLL
ncbi:MAG: hypothetical protein IMZ74_04285 [Actinobacteria bacterium]|jgi:hypothetical protein|nr:hypothetical protein [Actinomycetota bacterium]